MALTHNTVDGTLVIPNAYAKYTVKTAASGLATSGVLMIVGEADGGNSFSEDTDSSDYTFGPNSLEAVRAKYLSGPIVDAYRGGVLASADPKITGTFSSIVIIKTNIGTRASSAMLGEGNAAYATLYARNQGIAGNQINYQITNSVEEVLPVADFTFIPPVGTVNFAFRIEGGAANAVSLSANDQPDDLVSDLDAISGVSATGGVNRNIIAVSGTLAVDANPASNPGANNILVTRSVAWAVTPSAGDTLVIPDTSPMAGGSDENVGAYVVLSATSTTIVAVKKSDAGKTGAVPGTITAPTDVSAASIAAVDDVVAYSPVSVTLDGTHPINGVGACFEFGMLTTGTDLLNRCFFDEEGNSLASTYISQSGAPKIVASASERRIKMNVYRAADGIQDQAFAGGEIAVKIGYVGTTATLTVDNDAKTITTNVTGGSGVNLSIDLTQLTTLAAVVDYIKSQTGYSAELGSTAFGFKASTVLDNGTFGICQAYASANPGRIKMDAFRFEEAVSDNLGLVQVGNPEARASAGLPLVTSGLVFLSGGAKGGTTNARVSSGLEVLESVRGNILVPLFSRDATADIEEGLTSSSSTYTISAINAAVKNHVIAMRAYKKQKNRQAIVSLADTFDNQKAAAANLAYAFMNMTFQDVKDVDSSGNIVQYLPWMGAIKAAGMQAGGFYRLIVNKQINCSGVLSREGDFNPLNDDQMEQALLAGLMPIKPGETGGFVWASDQTTYGTDNNFVFNSLQAIYAADICSLTVAQRFARTFVGESASDVSAAQALSFLDNVMLDMLRLKLIAPSDDAPRGFKNAVVNISGPVMSVSLEIKLATGIYFIPIDFQISQVEQTAGQ